MEPPTAWPHRPPGGRERWVDLGCGHRPVSGAYGLDVVALPGVAIVARLEAPHLPFRDGQIDRLFAFNVLEHLDDLPRVMEEIHGTLRPQGTCSVEVPYFSSVSAFADPTHRRWFTYTTFDHFGPAATSGWQANRHTWFGNARFRVVRARLGFGRAHRMLGLASLANRFPAIYENLFVYWFPARTLHVELQKL